MYKWAETCDACLAQDDGLLASSLEGNLLRKEEDFCSQKKLGWSQLLFLWSEMRFKLYGTHQSVERLQSSITSSPKFAKKASQEVSH